MTTPVAFPNPNYTGTAASSSSDTSGTGSAANSSTLGGTNFLTLMLAQLKNQDPTSPVDSNQFLNQLASLSTVQGITQLNTSFASLSSSLTSASDGSDRKGTPVKSSRPSLAPRPTVTTCAGTPRLVSSRTWPTV